MPHRKLVPQFEVIPDQKIAYLVIRKSACTSIKHAISQVRDTQPLQADGLQVHGRSSFEWFANKIENPQQWFTFTFVREPIERFLSFYVNKIHSNDLKYNHTFREYDSFGLLPNMTVDQVIDVLVDPNYETEPHILRQTEILNAVGFELKLVGKLEELDVGLQQIKNTTGLDLPLGHLNRASNKAILPTPQQFDRLANYYADDLATFGYSTDYSQWKQRFVKGRKPEQIQTEQGYTFQDEAKLLNHSTHQRPEGFVIQLNWRVHPEQFRRRHVRVLRKTDAGMELVVHLKPNRNLSADADESGNAIEKLYVPGEKFAVDESFTNIFFEVYFSDAEQKRTRLTDYRGHVNKVVLSFCPINVPAKQR